mgnify:CR=1 FL=1
MIKSANQHPTHSLLSPQDKTTCRPPSGSRRSAFNSRLSLARGWPHHHAWVIWDWHVLCNDQIRIPIHLRPTYDSLVRISTVNQGTSDDPSPDGRRDGEYRYEIR